VGPIHGRGRFHTLGRFVVNRIQHLNPLTPKNKAARIAWDELSRRAELMVPPRNPVRVWFDDSQDEGYWCAKLDGVDADGLHDYIEMDGLEVRDRKNNPHKYQKKIAPKETI
jgi:hypothetical protein